MARGCGDSRLVYWKRAGRYGYSYTLEATGALGGGMAKTYTLDGERPRRTARDIAVSIANGRGVTEEEIAVEFFGGEVFEEWRRLYEEATGRKCDLQPVH